MEPGKNTPALQQKHSQGSSLIKVDRESLQLALKAPNAVVAFKEHPTVAMAVRSLGRAEVMVAMTVAIEKAFAEYFSAEQRMDPALHASFAESIMDDYPHESPADVVLFIKYAARGKYGETKEILDKEGYVTRREIINRGKTFGRLTTTLAMDWFRQYLGEKADAIAGMVPEFVAHPSKARNEEPPHQKIVDIMKKVRAERPPEEEHDGRRIAFLLRVAPHMSRERLRYEWTKCKTRSEKRILRQIATDKGWVAEWIKEQLEKREQQNLTQNDTL